MVYGVGSTADICTASLCLGANPIRIDCPNITKTALFLVNCRSKLIAKSTINFATDSAGANLLPAAAFIFIIMLSL